MQAIRVTAAELHPHCDALHVHGITVGDGRSLVEALGPDPQAQAEDDAALDDDVRYELDVFPSGPDDRLTGSAIAAVLRDQRTQGGVPEQLQWIVGLVDKGERRLLPRFQWRLRDQLEPGDDFHLAIAYHVFAADVHGVDPDTVPTMSYRLYGLVQPLFRASLEPGAPAWFTTVPVGYDGPSAPHELIMAPKDLPDPNQGTDRFAGYSNHHATVRKRRSASASSGAARTSAKASRH